MVKMVRTSASNNRTNGAGAKRGAPRSGPRKMLKGRFKGPALKLGAANGSDARLKIISKNRSKLVDARDKLVSLAKGSDARQKLVKLRNLREGKVCLLMDQLMINRIFFKVLIRAFAHLMPRYALTLFLCTL